MLHLSECLGKFKNFGVKEAAVKKAAALAIENVLNMQIDIKDISIKSLTVKIKGKPVFKNELFLKKTLILEILNKEIEGITKIVDLK